MAQARWRARWRGRRARWRGRRRSAAGCAPRGAPGRRCGTCRDGGECVSGMGAGCWTRTPTSRWNTSICSVCRRWWPRGGDGLGGAACGAGRGRAGAGVHRGAGGGGPVVGAGPVLGAGAGTATRLPGRWFYRSRWVRAAAAGPIRPAVPGRRSATRSTVRIRRGASGRRSGWCCPTVRASAARRSPGRERHSCRRFLQVRVGVGCTEQALLRGGLRGLAVPSSAQRPVMGANHHMTPGRGRHGLAERGSRPWLCGSGQQAPATSSWWTPSEQRLCVTPVAGTGQRDPCRPRVPA